MFMTSNQLAAVIRNGKRDSEFRNNAAKVAKYEREIQEYEDFCKKFGFPD